jgi:hypothetical protein
MTAHCFLKRVSQGSKRRRFIHSVWANVFLLPFRLFFRATLVQRVNGPVVMDYPIPVPMSVSRLDPVGLENLKKLAAD